MRQIFIRLIVAVAIIVAMLCIQSRADQWTYFYPEHVTAMSYKVSEVTLEINGVGTTGTAWQCNAYAIRDDPSLGNWTMPVATYRWPDVGKTPQDKAKAEKEIRKLRHKADAACSKWLDEASARVRKAQR
jgi:hypothetical protein